MKPAEYFNQYFTKEHFLELYKDYIKYNSAVGLDGINIERFGNRIEEEIDLILRKVNNLSYKFTNYKLS